MKSLHARIVLFAVCVTCLAWVGPSTPTADAQITDVASETLADANISVLATISTKNAGDNNGAMVIRSIRNIGRDVTFDTTLSNIFSAELRTIPDQPAFPPVRLPGHNGANPPFAIDSIIGRVAEYPNNTPFGLSKAGNVMTLTWTDIPVPNTASQTLTVEVNITLRPDSTLQWDIDANLSPGPYGIYALRFPYLVCNVINGSPTLDRFMLPLTGGMKLNNPVNTPNNLIEVDPVEGHTRSALFTYPGNMMSQFMAFYDSDGDDGAGLYMQAEDSAGYTKNLYFNSAFARRAPQQRRLYFYFTHFNSIPSQNQEPDPNARQAAFRTFDPNAKFGYRMVTKSFHGDWVDAAKLYRRWAIDSGAPWTLGGKLRDRTDIGPFLKNTGFAYRRQLPPSPTAIDPAVEYAKDQELLDYYAELLQEGYQTQLCRDFTPLMIVGQYLEDASGNPTFGAGDDVSLPLRSGVAEWLNLLKTANPSVDRPVREVALNFDTAGIPGHSADIATALQQAVMWTAKLAPMEKVPHLLPETYYRTCLGAARDPLQPPGALRAGWLFQRRAQIVMDTVEDSRYPASTGPPGLSMAALSGQGNFSFLCYAPIVDDPAVSTADHVHPAGGGNYSQLAWQEFAAEMRARTSAPPYGIPFMLMGLEHEPETLLRDQVLVGRSFSEPYDDAEPGVDRTIVGSDPIPLFKILYHDYGLWPAKVLPFASVVDTYFPGYPDTANRANWEYPLLSMMTNVRYRTAQLAMQGRLLVMQLSFAPQLVAYEGLPANIPHELQDEHVYFAAMAALRLLVPQYLIYGRGLKDPQFDLIDENDRVAVKTKRAGLKRTDMVQPIVGSAWRSEDASEPGGSTIGLVFTNFTESDTEFEFDITPADWELTSGTFKVQQTSYRRSSGSCVGLGGPAETWEDTGIAFSWDGTDATPNSSGPIEIEGAFPCALLQGPTIGPNPLPEPWRVYRVVRTGP